MDDVFNAKPNLGKVWPFCCLLSFSLRVPVDDDLSNSFAGMRITHSYDPNWYPDTGATYDW